MFQTDPVLWLQSTLEGSGLLALMTAISALGYAPAYMLLIAFSAFAGRVRPGLAVLLAVLLMSCTTAVIKHGANLPRPSDVDSRVLDKGRSGHALVAEGSAPGFWALPEHHAVAAFRAQDERDPGFPSGHVAVATAASVALMLGFQVRRWPLRLLLVAGWPLLMAVSRMFLGRHFLADVLAGALLGAVVACLAVWLVPPRRPSHAGARQALLIAAATAAVALACSSPWVGADSAGQLAGLVVVLIWLDLRGTPADAGAWTSRLARAAVFIGLNLLAVPVIDGLATALQLPDTRATVVLCHAAGTLMVMLATLSLCRLSWLQRGSTRVPAVA